MPRVKDIAWKFVTRLGGEKWRCPHCETEYSGKVTRVKSHFLKHPNKGICPCKKVPEHISMLMDWLHNQDRNKEDIAWKFVDRLEDNKWRCHYCSVEFFGDLTGVKGHLLKAPIEGISICTQVPDHVRTLMRSLLDEVAEEESREAHGQSSMEPQPLYMPTQAEVAGVESREANRQFSTEPESGDKLLPAVPLFQSFGDAEIFLSTTEWAPDPEIRISDLERYFHVAMPSVPQNIHGESSTMASTEEVPNSHNLLYQPQCYIQSQMQVNVQQTLAGASSFPDDQLPAVDNLDCLQDCNQHSQLQTSMDIDPSIAPQHTSETHIIEAMMLDLQVPEAATNTTGPSSSQASVPPQHQSAPHQSETRNVLQNPTAPSSTALIDMDSWILSSLQAPNEAPQGATDVSNFNQQDFVGLNSDQRSLPERQFPQSSAMPLLVQSSHGESISCSTMALAEVEALHDLPDQSQCNIRSQIQMNDQQTPAGESASQYDQLPTVGNSNCLQDGNQHSQLQIPIHSDPSIVSQHTIDSHVIEATIVDLQVPKVATNTMSLSSSQAMNRGSPIINVRGIYANDQDIRNLKRKVEELDDKEAVIKEQMKIESAASSVRKKPRILVERWLKETERTRNNFQIIGQAHAETLPPKEQVKTLRREVEELIGQTLPQTLLIEERDAKGVKFLERKLTGEVIHKNIELIWDHLMKNHGCKLGIHGMGGVGKTTIMMHIHDRLLEDASFDGVIFITVSQDFSIYKLQSDIWKAFEFGVMEDEHENKRAAMLSKQLERKKNCVLILDDVWERLDLEEVGIPVRADGLTLVLTTRVFDVCRQMQCKMTISINPLSQQAAESLFLEELGSEVALNSKIKAIVKAIVRECAGLPIGVITMARSMRGVTYEYEWRDSLMKLKESCKGQMDMEKKVIMNLKFSYDRLGNPDVQQCFLSCALYPEDKLMDRFELVEFFIDQGLIGGLNTRKEQFDRGYTILNQLGNACLLEFWCSDRMKMHDLIRDMALHIMSETSIVKAGKRSTRIPLEEDWTNALEKVSLMENEISEFPLNMSPNCPKLSTLLLNGCLLRNLAIPDSFFKNLLGLKVLNLSENHMTELPNSISDLVNLRALLLSKCQNLRCIPDLGKLTSLRKLDAKECRSLEAIDGLEKLMNLRYLYLTKTRIKRLPKLVNLRYLDLTGTCIERFPEGTLDHLLNLQYLKVSTVKEEDITKLGALETFKCYSNNANDFNKCVRAIQQSNNPRYYCLDVRLNEPKFLAKVSDDTQFWIWGRGVHIWEWNHAIVSVGGECTGIFIMIPQDVQKMTMYCCDGITNLFGMGSLDCLEELEIQESKTLEVLYGEQDEEVIDIHDSPGPTPTPLLFSSLRVLKIDTCPKLKYLFGYGSKSNLPHLREIEIGGCEEMVGIIAAVTSPPPHPLPFFPSLEEILINDCHKMKKAVEFEWMPHFPNLRSIQVSNCKKMEEIIRGPPPYLPVEEISLESLHVWLCDNMRKLFPHEWMLHLRNLQCISIAGCKGMVEMISGAGQGQEGSITTPIINTSSSIRSPISLPKLKGLRLTDLPQLKSICEVPISCDFMKALSVYRCPELKGIPLQLRLREIEELPHIGVEDEEKWKTLMWDHPDAQAILQPYLRKEEDAIALDARRKISQDSALEESLAAQPCFPANSTQVAI